MGLLLQWNKLRKGGVLRTSSQLLAPDQTTAHFNEVVDEVLRKLLQKNRASDVGIARSTSSVMDLDSKVTPLMSPASTGAVDSPLAAAVKRSSLDDSLPRVTSLIPSLAGAPIPRTISLITSPQGAAKGQSNAPQSPTIATISEGKSTGQSKRRSGGGSLPKAV